MVARGREPEQDQGMVPSFLRSKGERKPGVGEDAGVGPDANGTFSERSQK